MIASLLASIGLPVLVKTASDALKKIDSNVAKNAAEALDAVVGAINENKITPEQVAEANRHTEKMTELDNLVSSETIKQVNESFRAELVIDDKYVRRWRPTFGYSVAIAWLGTMFSVAYSIVVQPDKAPTIITSLMNLSSLWGVALGVLGVSVIKRSQDKVGCKQSLLLSKD